MKERNKMKRQVTRREFIGSAAAVAACTMMPGYVLGQRASKPNSNFNGVQIGAITYSFRSIPSSADDILGYLVKCGLSSCEMMYGPVEQFAGAPSGQGGAQQRTPQTEEQKTKMRAAREAQAKELAKWRASPPWEKFKELRKKYEDAGVKINIIKYDQLGSMSDVELDYAFNACRTLGAKGITVELSEETAKRVAPFADKHKLFVAFHNHTQVNSKSFDTPLSYSKFLAMNFDVGHYLAGTDESPIPIIQKYSKRILSLHLKDRKSKQNGGDNLPWGQGDTPIKEILQLMKKEKYPFTADIEYEYKTPEGSDVLTEIAKCVKYCRDALA
jgi:sugar phosphate isomerase/epimerase